MARKQMAEVHSMMILLNNLRLLLVADDIQNGLRDQISWFCEQIEVLFGFLLVYYSEAEGCSSDHHHQQHLAAGASSNDEMNRVVGMIRDFSVESGDVVVDTFDKIISKQYTNSTTDDEPLAHNDNPAAAISVSDLHEQIKSIVSLIHAYNNEEYYRIVYKKAVGESVQISNPHRNHRRKDGNQSTGFQFYVYMMLMRLLDTDQGIKQLNVIAITGEGGTGKTTLARAIYNILKKYFDCCGWMLVSRTYVLRGLLLSVLEDIMVITKEIYEMEEWELKLQLSKQLRGRRYLIVIDDVWNTQAWDELKDLFPDNSNYSRILLTSRSPSVASYATRPGLKSFPLPEEFFGSKTDHRNKLQEYYDNEFNSEEIWQCDCFELRSLNEVDSWNLFCTIYFRGNKSPYYDELVDDGTRIVRRCCGRPLVISALAHILRATDRVDGSSWFGLASQIDKELSGDYNQQMDILSLCFHKLPQHLQSCFLYLGAFPEDTEISVKQLIQLWIAEGLIGLPVSQENNANLTLEDVAEHYLEELISLRLIKVSKTRSDDGAKSFHIHDMLREFCIRLSKEEGFFEVTHNGGDHFSGAHQIHPKKLSILGNCGEYLSKSSNSSDPCCSHVRSLSCFSQDTQSFSRENWESLFSHFPLLRVLNIGEQETQNKLPETIGVLSHLRYLKVKAAKNITVPKSIFNLWNLQTIDLRKASLPKLPEGLWKMQQLRHLYLGGRSKLPIPRDEDCLPNLLTLSYIPNDPKVEIHISKKAPNLRKLGFNGYRFASKAKQQATFNLQHLQSLKFAQQCSFEEPITLPATITKITVEGALLKPNVIHMFGRLPNLLFLKLVQTNFENDQLEVLEKDLFPELKLLQLANSTIVIWKLEEGAMPKLQRVIFSSCSQLPKLPDELWKMPTLNELELFWPSIELVNSLPRDFKVREGFKLVIYPPNQM